MENEILIVEGMRCEGCKQKVESALDELAGVIAAEVDLGANTVDVTYDSDLVNHDAIRNCIEALGYVVVV